jgi:hypothetical protein
MHVGGDAHPIYYYRRPYVCAASSANIPEGFILRLRNILHGLLLDFDA